MKKLIKNISPFNNREEMSKVEFVIKKLLAFLLIYFISMILAEGIIIGIHYLLGYDVLHGETMDFEQMSLLKYYGYSVFLIITVLYCVTIEKRTLRSMGFRNRPLDYVKGSLLAAVLLLAVISILLVTGNMQFGGLAKEQNWSLMIAFFLAFVIQGVMEETMCRGFLMLSLTGKISSRWAILISASVFVVPHVSSMPSENPLYGVIGILNIYLVSALFSLLIFRAGNLWMACGMHSVWNFILYSVVGVNLSGVEVSGASVFNFSAKQQNLWNGGSYGVEAGLAVTIVLGLAILFFFRKCKACLAGGAGYGIS